MNERFQTDWSGTSFFLCYNIFNEIKIENYWYVWHFVGLADEVENEDFSRCGRLSGNKNCRTKSERT